MPNAEKPAASVETQLEEILEHLRRMDARDKLRTWGGFIRGIIAIVPIILLLWSSWYFVKHGPELMKMISDTAASSAAQFTEGRIQSAADQMMR